MAGRARLCLIETWDVLKSLDDGTKKYVDLFNRNMGCIEMYINGLMETETYFV